MAGISPVISEHDGEPAIRIQQVGPDQTRQALAVLLTGRPAEQNPAVDRFLRFSAEQSLSLEHLWVARAGDKAVAATLLVPNDGRTAMLFLSPATTRRWVATCGRLVRTACGGQSSSRVHLIQSLLDPGQGRQQRALEEAGFWPLAQLVYMQRQVDRPTPPPTLGSGSIEVLHWSEANRRAFADALLASYEQTQDCPGLLGVRQIDDIIAGHMTTGRFDPRFWLVLRHEGEPVGVMLLNEVPQQQGFELVYLGVSVRFRRQGWARRMLQQGLALASTRGVLSIVLAVDQRNAPALRLYRGFGFRTTARKAAMILTLK